jgi:hypothetical protein
MSFIKQYKKMKAYRYNYSISSDKYQKINIKKMSYILCPECRNCLGEVGKFVVLAKQGFIQTIIADKYKDIDINKVDMDEDVSIGFILDLVGAKLICCRQHLLGIRENEVVMF